MVYTRITNRLMSDNVIQNLLTNRSKLNTLQEQISSGKRIDLPSDDPTASMSVLSARTSLSKIEGYLKNIDTASSELDATDQMLQNTVDIIHKTRELTITAANATTGTNELTAINDEVQQLLQQVKDIGNTQFGDKYIFGGLVTNKPPFDVNASGEIQYAGTPYDAGGSHERKIEIIDNTTVPVNIAGDKAFGQYYTDNSTTPPTVVSEGLIGTLTQLGKELTAVTPDKNKIREILNNLDTDLSNTLSLQATTGGLSSRIEMTKNKLEDNNVLFTKIRSNAEDIDLPKAISDLQFQESALQASIQVSAQIIQPSLLQYL